MTRTAGILALLLLATAASAATQSDDVVVFTSQIRKPDVGTASTFEARVMNVSGQPLQGVDLLLRLHGNATITAASNEMMACTRESDQLVRCHSGATLQHDASLTVPVTISHVPERRLAVITTAEWTRAGEQFTTEPEYSFVLFPRQLVVTNTGDEGPGSLRAVLDHANANCGDVPCEITFNPGGRIILNTPLAPITAPDIIINGGGSTTLDGDALWFGSGLVLAGTGVFSIRDIHITRFPWDGVAVVRQLPAGSPFTSTINFTTIDLNGSRGITLHPPANAVHMSRNTISSNGRSGVFIVGGRDVRVDINTIADNGASGVYVSAESQHVTVYRNDLRDNRHWGLTIGRGAERVEVQDNTIHGNRIAGIDVGIDGADAFVYAPAVGEVGPPVLTSARRDPVTGQDIVTGIVPSAAGTWDITVFFSTKAGDAQGFVGRTTAVNGTFTLILPDQLPLGYYLIASAVHSVNGEVWSTELSNPVQVQYNN
jgi:hypothetical protein